MPGIFSFIKQPILGLLEKSDQLIPGLEKAIALYYDNNLSELQCKGFVKNKHTIVIDDFAIEDIAATQKLRTRSFKHQWMAADSLPFSIEKKGKKQLNIFDELDNVVLCVGFKNDSDNLTDLLFLYLNHNKGNFGISNSNQNLTTSEKSIIGTMAFNSLNVYRNQQLTDSDTLKLINNKVQFLHDENDKLNLKLINLTENYLASVIEMCNSHLSNLSNEYGIAFSFSSDAIEKLKYFNGNIDELKEKLTNSALLAVNLNYGQQNKQIVLKAWDIDFSKKSEIDNDIHQSDVHERYHKTLLLLNKLENAARSVTNKHQKLTSENVGNACPTPISAPAISDALKNHQRKLIKLMHDHPEKWPTIRNEFRPVKNILHNSNVG